jgi:hypothetical protein
MFRLLKLMAYALFGYAIYEFFRGMSNAGGGPAGSEFGESIRRMGREARESFGQMSGQQMSGPAEGREEATLDADGGSVRHRVGRGVTTGM